MESAVIVKNLVKNFEVVERKEGFFNSVSSFFFPKKKIIQALKGISFSVDEGEVLGFIGPNGSGKTTTMKILSGILYPTSGFTQVLGFDPWERKEDFLKKITLIMGQKSQIIPDLPAIETFSLIKAIYDIPDKSFKKTLGELVDMLGAQDLLQIPAKKLSLGQRARMELIASLIHQPKVLFLDEPAVGLDLIAQQDLRDFLYLYQKRLDATLIITSHNLSDILDFAKRVIIINKGEIIFDGSFGVLVERYSKYKLIKVFLSQPTDLKKLEKIGRVKGVKYPLVSLVVPRTTAVLASSEILQNFPVKDINIEDEPIEGIIRRIFKKGEKI